ncbi:MAG: M1 family metallopeptidase [Nanoarchaeota archaeon]
MDKKVVRLQDFVIPLNYEISIEPSKNMDSYKGSVKIKVQINKPTKNITLHSKNSEIRTVTICVENQCILSKLKENKESETINLEVKKEISGYIEIHIEFIGKITEDLAGIYKSTYQYNGKKEHLITTQCEAPYARRIFPCFDEPNKKATFDITAIIEKNLNSISNMQVESEKVENGKKIVKFKKTPKMSTYLFYLGVGDFEFAEENYKNVKIRVVTTPGKIKNASFALKQTKKYLKYFEDYSEIPYPLEKLDLIAIPDFTVSGMENWGAITFRDLVLLVDEEKTSTARKKISAEVISHELWHQWSGDLVTMKWWNDLWLNESFANYMAFKAVDHYNSEWNVWNDYLSGDLAVGLSKDTLKTTHPIEVEIKSPEEIGEIFDEISYQKGGSVLRMLENYIGEENFRKGVSNYLKKYSYDNATASDLWDSLDKVSKEKKVKEIMKSWISQEGYPLVSLEKVKSGIKISQKRCNKSTNQLWPIPISIYTKERIYNELLDGKEKLISIKDSQLKVNHKHFGFYRTKYSIELLDSLGKLVKNKELNKEDRWGLNNDMWALCNIGEEVLENYLKFLNNYENEETYITLAEIYGSLRKLERLFYDESWWPKSKERIVKNIIPNYKNKLAKLGWENKNEDTTEDRLMRGLCINFCGFIEDKNTLSKIEELYQKGDFSMDIANSVYTMIARKGNIETFKDVIKKYENALDPENKIKLLSSIYYFLDSEILEKALDFSMTEKVKSQDLLYVFGHVAVNPISKKMILNWYNKNWDKIKKYEDNHYIMRSIIEALILPQTTQSGKNEAKEFLDKHKVGFEMTKDNAFEILDQNLKFIEKNKEFLKNY